MMELWKWTRDLTCGNFITTTESGISEFDALVLHTYNPFRYRGYFYDVETGLYYLQSRY